MKFSRRSFLILGGAAAVPPVAVAAQQATSTPEATVVRFLRRLTGDSRVSDGEMQDFAKHFVAQTRRTHGRKLDAAILIMDNRWMRVFLPPGMRITYDRFERTAFTDFLFSTDFFTSAGRDFSRMTYTGFADPYTTGCSNPLAVFDA